jgi:hypothetical protein
MRQPQTTRKAETIKLLSTSKKQKEEIKQIQKTAEFEADKNVQVNIWITANSSSNNLNLK